MARVLQISMKKIDRVKKRFVEEGIEVALNNKKSRRAYDKKTCIRQFEFDPSRQSDFDPP